MKGFCEYTGFSWLEVSRVEGRSDFVYVCVNCEWTLTVDIM